MGKQIKQINLTYSSRENISVKKRNILLFFFLFSIGEIMLFGSLLATFSKIKGKIGDTGDGFVSLIPLNVAVPISVCLIVSVLTFYFANRNIRGGKITIGKGWLLLTALLGIVFFGVIINELQDVVYKSVSPAVSIFYTMLALQALQFFVAVIWVAYLLLKNYNVGNFSMNPRFFMARHYWNLNVFLWVLIIVFVYSIL